MKRILAMVVSAMMILSAGICAQAEFDKNGSINVISREAGSGTRGAFIELFGIEVKGDDGSKKDMTSEEATIVSKTDVMMSSVSGDGAAIGYISLGSLNDTVKAMTIDSAQASVETIKSGLYKVSRPFYIATKGEGSALTQDFIGFVLSEQGQAVVGKSYIPVVDAAEPYNGLMPSGKLVIAGSSSVTPVMEKLVEAYKAINANAQIEIQMSDSTAGMTAAMDGRCDIGMSSRELKDSEKEALTPMQIALDGIVVIVNKANPIEDMTKDQVKAVFTGEVTNWNGVQ